MSSTTNPEGIQLPTAMTTAGGENRQDAQQRHHYEVIFWVLALIVFIAACIIIHFHPQPYPVDLTVTEDVQHAGIPTPIENVLNFPSMLNNPVPSAIALWVWVFGMLVAGLIAKLRHLAAVLWIEAAVFLAITVMSSAGLNVVIDELVGRPRPNPHIEPIQLHTALVPFPTFPSGHTEHDVAYYGFLLYLSFTKPVREWRYRWVLLPLQIYAVFDILAIGYSRVYLGDHWLTDVLGGYLEGAIYLFFFIFLYRLATDLLAKRFARHRIRKAIGER